MKHVYTVSHDLLYNVNDCAIKSLQDTGEISIFCTNWQSQPSGSIANAFEVFG